MCGGYVSALWSEESLQHLSASAQALPVTEAPGWESGSGRCTPLSGSPPELGWSVGRAPCWPAPLCFSRKKAHPGFGEEWRHTEGTGWQGSLFETEIGHFPPCSVLLPTWLQQQVGRWVLSAMKCPCPWKVTGHGNKLVSVSGASALSENLGGILRASWGCKGHRKARMGWRWCRRKSGRLSLPCADSAQQGRLTVAMNFSQGPDIALVWGHAFYCHRLC